MQDHTLYCLERNLLVNNLYLNKKSFILYSPISILAVPVTTLAINPISSFIQLFLIGIFVTLIIYLPFLVFFNLNHKIVDKPKSYRIIYFFISIGLIGLVRGVFAFLILNNLGYEQIGGLINRSFASILTTLFWLSCSNLLLNYFEDFKIKYQEALKGVLHDESNQKENNILELDKIQTILKDILTNQGKESTSKNLNNLSVMITNYINEELKPLSKRIWLKSLGEYPKMNLLQLIKDAIKIDEFSKVNYFLTLSFLSFINNLFIRDFTESFFRSVTFLIFLYIFVLFKMILNSRVNNFKFNINLISLFLIGFVPVLLSEYFSQILGFKGTWTGALIIAPIAPMLYLLFAIFGLLFKDQSLIIDLLNNLNFFKYSKDRNFDSDGRKVASFIHNSLQAELLALASKLEDAAFSENKDKSAQVFQQVTALANRSLIDDFNKFSESPLERLEFIKKSWRGLLEIKVNISEEILTNNNRNFLIVQMIEEFATNSYRYAKSTDISVTAEKTKNGVLLNLTNNGKSPIEKKKGLGSEWLDKISIKPWSLKSSKNGTTLSIEIA